MTALETGPTGLLFELYDNNGQLVTFSNHVPGGELI